MDATRMAIPNLVVPVGLDLRNGRRDAIAPATRSAAIRPEYFWHAVDVPTGPDAMRVTMGVIAEAFGRLASVALHAPVAPTSHIQDVTAVGFARTAPGTAHAAGTVADWAPTVATANSNAELRTRAICLGAARAGLHAVWRITAADISANERDTVPNIGWLDAAGDAAAVGTTPAAYGFPNGVSNALGNIPMGAAIAVGMTPLTDTEQDMAHVAFSLSMAAIPLAGCELMETGHHYLTSNLAPTRAVEKQVLSTASEAVRALWTGHTDAARDMIWHKSIHPIVRNVLVTAATSRSVKERLIRAGLGSAAVRLPYTESTLRGARAMVAIYRAIRSTLDEAGYNVRMDKLLNAVDYMDTYSAANPIPTETGLTPMTRFDALEDYLKPVMESAAVYVAWCAGMYMGICDDAMVTHSSNTLLRSRAVNRAVQENAGSVASGRAAYDNYRKFARERVKEGFLPQIDLAFVHGATVYNTSTANPNAQQPATAPATTTT